MTTNLDPQLALDERAINDAELEAALERHLRASDDVREANAVKKTYRKEIDAALAKHADFQVDSAIRCGRFRITKRTVEAKHVEFDAAEREQISIGLVDEDGIAAKRPAAARATSVSDDEDLRPKGPVNAEALRGEADRASEPTPIRRPTGGAQPPVTH